MEEQDRIGGYRLLERLGQGAFGVVWRGVCEEDAKPVPRGMEVAVKILHQHLAYGPDGERIVKRFQREARLATKLTHPHVVRVLDLGEDAGRHYLVMELAPGRSLSDYLKENGIAPVTVKSSMLTVTDKGDVKRSEPPPVLGLPAGEMIEILRQTAGVLQAACEIGLLHRDIKPDNLFIDKKVGKDGVERIDVKVLDFGLAKDLLAQSLSLTSMGSSVGTPAYMSPEQFDSATFGEPDIRSDLYSLGALAYHALTGRAPFQGPTPSSFMMQHQTEIPLSACKVNPKVPKALSEVVDRLLAKMPKDRHQTPAEVIEDLNRVERGQRPLVRYRPKRAKQRGWLVPVLAAAVLALAAGAGGLWYMNYSGRAGRMALAAAQTAEARELWADAIAEAQAGLALADLDAETAEQLRTIVSKAREELAAGRRAEDEALRARLAALREAAAKRLAESEAALAEGDFDEAEALLASASAGFAEVEDAAGVADAERLGRRVAGGREAAARRAAAEKAARERRLSFEAARDAAREILSFGDPDRLEQARDRAAAARGLAEGDEEIAEADDVAARIREAMARRKDVAAVLEFEVGGNIEGVSGQAVAVRLEQALGGQYRLVSRSLVSKALEELQFQQTDLFDQNNADRFAEFVKARYAVTGHIVRIGDELTVAAQVVDLRTAAIRRRGEVTARDAGELNALFPELAMQLEMDEATQQRYVREHRDFPRWLAEGEARLAEARAAEARAREAARTGGEQERAAPKGDYVESYANAERGWRQAEEGYGQAVSFLRRALSAKADDGVKALLAQAEERRSAASGQREDVSATLSGARKRRDAYRGAMAQGDARLAAEDWDAAAKAYGSALAVPGYADDARAKNGVSLATHGPTRKAYTTAMALAEEKLAAEDWKGAEAAYEAALRVKGYGDDARARTGLARSRTGAVDKAFSTSLALGEERLAAEDWLGAEAAFEAALRVPGHGDNARAKRGLERSRTGAADKAFTTALALGEERLAAEDWLGAEAAFEEALDAPGYGDNARAKRGLERSRTGASDKAFSTALALGEERLSAEDWLGAEAAFEEALDAPGYGDNSRAKRGLARSRTGANDKAFAAAFTLGEKLLSAEDWVGAEAAFAEALRVPGYADNARAKSGLVRSQTGAEDKRFSTALARGEGLLAAEDWKGAEAAFNDAQRVLGYAEDARTKQGLAQARAGATGKAFSTALARGEKMLAAEDWKGAEAAFTEALRVPGYADNAKANQGLAQARAGATGKAFSTALARGEKMLAAEDWKGAEAAFEEALRVPGYGNDSRAKQGLSRSRTGEADKAFSAAVTLGEQKLAAEDWRAAASAFEAALKVPGYGVDSRATRGLDKARNGAKNKTFVMAMTLGKEKLAAEEWAAAEAAYAAALQVPGFERNADAQNGLREAKGGATLKMYRLAIDLGERKLLDEDWTAAAAAFQAALRAPGYEKDARARAGLEHAEGGAPLKAYRLAVALGDEKLAAEEWKAAEAAYAAALTVPGYEKDTRAMQGLGEARGGAPLKGYRLAMAEGDRKLKAEDWSGAETMYQAALKIEGFAGDAAAQAGVRKARGGAAEKEYTAAMAAGDKALAAKRWSDAEAAYARALRAPGYGQNAAARRGVERAKGGEALVRHDENMARANSLAAAKDWSAAKNAFVSAKKAVDKYDESGLDWDKWAAEKGQAEAQAAMASRYYDGKGVTKDLPESVKWYRLAANQGHAVAQNGLGNRLYSGEGVEKNYAEAVKWYRLSADKGNAWAQYNLANCYYNGRGVSQNYVEAVKWYRLSANQGNAAAQNTLGVCYHDGGKGVSENKHEAVRWWRLSAAQGNSAAQYNLGHSYMDGCGVDANYHEAIKWYRLSARQGDADAQKELRTRGEGW